MAAADRLVPRTAPRAASRAAGPSLAFALALGACATPAYAPCPVDAAPLPEDAFARCQATVRRLYGGVAEADAATCRVQSVWTPVADPPGERRATVFRDDAAPDDLAVIVELRWLSVPWLGLPQWTTARGDAAAERELANALREALTPSPPRIAERSR
jgi:hypothetical protein